MRLLCGVAAALALTACAPTIPDSGAGVGFGDYNSYEAARLAREAELRGDRPAAPTMWEGPLDATGAGSAAAGTSSDAISAEELSAAGLPVGERATPSFDRPETAPSARVDINNPGISDEQSFEAVSSRETIESDRERLEAQREAYEVIRPEPLPTRRGDTGPNIVQYALNTSNDVGEQVYRRIGIAKESRFLRNCAEYASSDLAQQDFLARGGPERDRKGLDPDGDGFACYWDPTPFRRAVRN
ncbi:hypothetical protein [Tranquillimonas alkanivorans]|uniref:Excalibur calcium-binding domain-containing protein n=1 Tax=Tranquillimonas alkanivorans TaxID=441119 RepID=A0A1I5M974_9RHOB|nr:hypothetical protein [Tranquillimonas alkanivorans]SFP05561.1 hypothetical protein SAMN04488047_102138 [Tranquillimonas alkanivorans]